MEPATYAPLSAAAGAALVDDILDLLGGVHPADASTAIIIATAVTARRQGVAPSRACAALHAAMADMVEEA